MAIIQFDAKYAMAQIQRIQAANLKIIQAVQPSGGLGAAVHFMLTQGHRVSINLTHVDTGALKSSERMDFDQAVPRGEIYLDEGVMNPRTGQMPAKYGVFEHARGGSHAFFKRTVDEHGRQIGHGGARVLRGYMP